MSDKNVGRLSVRHRCCAPQENYSKAMHDETVVVVFFNVTLKNLHVHADISSWCARFKYNNFNYCFVDKYDLSQDATWRQLLLLWRKRFHFYAFQGFKQIVSLGTKNSYSHPELSFQIVTNEIKMAFCADVVFLRTVCMAHSDNYFSATMFGNS